MLFEAEVRVKHNTKQLNPRNCGVWQFFQPLQLLAAFLQAGLVFGRQSTHFVPSSGIVVGL